jgi:elongation factor 2
LAFDSWEIVKGSPFDNGSYANQIVMDVRKRKGLKLELPNFNDYCDKL